MARTPEEILREYLGNQVIQLISLQAEVERLREQVGAVPDPPVAPAPTTKPNGKEQERAR